MIQGEETSDAAFSNARESGGFLFCSGQIGLDPDGSVPDEPAIQFQRAFAALAEVLAHHGCCEADVVDLMSFHVGYPEHMATFMAEMADAMPGATRAWTAIGVASVGYPGSLVELKAVARIGAKRECTDVSM